MNLADDRSATRRAGRARRTTHLLAGLLALPLVLGGCSTVPDWADPTDWFAADQAPTKVGLSQGQAGYMQSASFPNLASVPDTAPRVTPRATRVQIQNSLAADRANAQYSGERLVGAPPSGSPSLGATAPVSQAAPGQPAPVQQAAGQLRVPKPPRAAAPAPGSAATAGAPPVPRIAGDLVGQGQAPSSPTPAPTPAPAPARSQVAQVAQVAQSAAGPAQLRFPQFQGTQFQAPQFQGPQFEGGSAAVAPRLVALGAQLVAVIYFGHSSAQLDASDRGVLREVVALQRQRGGTIRVVGHASAHTAVVDQIKHRLANFEMSLKRANAVAAGLVAAGAARNEVRAEAKGDAQPIFHEFMPTGEAGNRRTEIFLEN